MAAAVLLACAMMMSAFVAAALILLRTYYWSHTAAESGAAADQQPQAQDQVPYSQPVQQAQPAQQVQQQAVPIVAKTITKPVANPALRPPQQQPRPQQQPAPQPAVKGGWKRATATYFHSYPPCCPGSPTYNSGASKSECSDFNGCTWMGQFAGAGKQSFQWVKNNNIVSFFELGQTEGSWNAKWKGRRILLRNPRTGKTMVATILDRCADSDCKGCCSENARQNGGYLVDLEVFTAQRFWGTNRVPGMANLEWQLA